MGAAAAPPPVATRSDIEFVTTGPSADKKGDLAAGVEEGMEEVDVEAGESGGRVGGGRGMDNDFEL